jgi:hypothetical protein
MRETRLNITQFKSAYACRSISLFGFLTLLHGRVVLVAARNVVTKRGRSGASFFLSAASEVHGTDFFRHALQSYDDYDP